MTVKKTNIHKKRSVSDGEIVDKQTRGNVAFAVDKKGIARAFEASSQDGFVVNDRVLLVFLKDIFIVLKSIEAHLAVLTEETFDGSN